MAEWIAVDDRLVDWSKIDIPRCEWPGIESTPLPPSIYEVMVDLALKREGRMGGNMPPTNTLLTVEVVTDDDTGIWQIGELEFGKTGHCEDYLRSKPGNREKFVAWLRWLADAAENGTAPFRALDKTMESQGERK